MKKMKLFVPITKVEKTADDTRMVFGVLALEEVDKDKEVMDYDKSKKFFEAWNSNYREKTKAMGVEESCGNLRAMHKSISAGAFRDMAYDDAAKTITVAAEVVDKDEVQKVDKGVYTGFSIGARRVESEYDVKLKALRWVADPYEGSIVDNPCMFSAAITAVKAANAGDENAEVVKYVGKSGEKVAKGLWYVSRMADLLQSLLWLADDVDCEAQYEMDGSPIPDELKAQCKSLAETLKKYVVEEADEAVASMNKAEGATEMNKSKAAGVLAEPGERPTATPDEAGVKPNAEKTETSAAAAATSTTEPAVSPETGTQTVTDEKVAKMVEDAQKLVAKVTTLETENAALKADVAKANETVEKVNTALAEIQKRLDAPMPTAAKLKGAVVVGKEGDDGEVEKSDAQKVADAEKKAKDTGDITERLKLIHANGPTQRR